jgi:uncharacterized repeat protein (TIGR02543 family)
MGDVQRDLGASEAEYPVWGQLLKDAFTRNPDVRFGLMGGDMVENGAESRDWKYFLSYAQNAFSDIPLMPTIGNHESNFMGGKPLYYLDIMNLPQNGSAGFKEEFYSFDYGSVHVTVLNSWALSPEQGVFGYDGSLKKPDVLTALNKWVSEDLTQAKGAKFRVVLLHHPAYSMANDPVANRVLQYWEPLFVSGGVDLALVGHQHVYGRTNPLNAGVPDTQKGVTWVMGNAGLKYYSTADSTYWSTLLFRTSTYQVVSVSGDTMTLETFDRDGLLRDTWSKTSTVPDGGQTGAAIAHLETAKRVKLLFAANGGKVGVKSKTVAYGAKYGKLAKPTRPGYRFVGWYTKAKGGKRITAGTKVTVEKGIKLYAHWRKL